MPENGSHETLDMIRGMIHFHEAHSYSKATEIHLSKQLYEKVRKEVERWMNTKGVELEEGKHPSALFGLRIYVNDQYRPDDAVIVGIPRA